MLNQGRNDHGAVLRKEGTFLVNLQKLDGDDIGLEFDTMDSTVLLVSNLVETDFIRSYVLKPRNFTKPVDSPSQTPPRTAKPIQCLSMLWAKAKYVEVASPLAGMPQLRRSRRFGVWACIYYKVVMESPASPNRPYIIISSYCSSIHQPCSTCSYPYITGISGASLSIASGTR